VVIGYVGKDSSQEIPVKASQAQAGYLDWLQRLTERTALASIGGERLAREEAKWQAPRQSDADAIEQAAEMMDRFNRIFLRTLRALRNLRRYAGPVIVKNAGQVNVGGQQLNMTREEKYPFLDRRAWWLSWLS
jgi:hypothetical protein